MESVPEIQSTPPVETLNTESSDDNDMDIGTSRIDFKDVTNVKNAFDCSEEMHTTKLGSLPTKSPSAK
jgi:hypothetical protein